MSIGGDGEFDVCGTVMFRSDEIVDRVGKYASILPEGYRGEVNLGIGETWVSSVGRIRYKSGYVLTIDYGYERDTLYHPV